jgi:hypothetical protein
MSADARGEIRTALHRLVAESGGQMVRRPVFRDRPSADWMRDEPEPLAGIRAAVALEHEARRAIAESARYAREDGISWEQIGETLIPAHPRVEGSSRAEAAFARLSWSYDQWQSPSFNWTCPACLQLIRDYGPGIGGHPSEIEEGHAESCERLAATVAAWNAQREDE